ncbi:MAG: YggT family protein [Clostridia bacterium]|nr:YggT family protein [Clostridia bacterium]
MSLFLTLLVGTVRALLSIVQLCFLVRAILSWFPLREDNPFLLLVTMVTEPIILPFRALFDRLGWFRNMPLDMPFFFGFITVSLVSSFLLL